MSKLKQKITSDALVSTEEIAPVKPEKTKAVKKVEIKEFFAKSAKSKVVKKEATKEATGIWTKGIETVMKKKSGGDWRNNLGKKIAIAIAAVFILSLIVATGYFYYQWRQIKNNSQGVTKNALSDIVTEVGKLIELPMGEEPTMATVTNVERLKDQPFFAKAQNGDHVLIFSQSGKAILYRPSTNKIIEVISLVGGEQTIGNQVLSANQSMSDKSTQPAEVATQITEKPKMANVAIYNGTTQKGLAKRVSTKLETLTETKVTLIGNAKGNFEKTLIVDISGNNQDLVQKISQTIGGEIGVLPEGEVKPEVDILIIGGDDFKN